MFRLGEIAVPHRTMIVAEIGNNHEGSFDLAAKMIDLAAKAGADAVKFQTYRTEEYVAASQRERFARLKKFELSFAQFERLVSVARANGVLFLSTPFDLESADFLRSLVPAFKISSGDNVFFPLIEKIAGFKMPVLLSTGLSSINGIARTLRFIERKWETENHEGEIALLHCVSKYPTPPGEANLGMIRALKALFQRPVGYSDHTVGTEAACLACAMGAGVIEKHFTIDKNYSDFRDHQLSADPAEMAELVRRIRETETLCGEEYAPDHGDTSAMRRSIVARKSLEAGSLLGMDDISWVRPGGGLSPGEEQRLLGKRSIGRIEAGTPLSPELFEDGENAE